MAEGIITVITPVFNGLNYVDTAWQSLLAQTHTKWEWFVVDNASTDDGIAKLRTLVDGDSRVRFFYEPRRGTGNARACAPVWIQVSQGACTSSKGGSRGESRGETGV